MRYLGTTEHLILLAISRLGEDAYGASIRRAFEDADQRAPSSGSLSTSLDRMEAKGLVTSRYVKGDEDRGGYKRRMVTITAAGQQALEHTGLALRALGGREPEASP